MAGGISASGLITGMDTGALIQQLMQLERQPMNRIQQRIQGLEQQQSSLRELRTQMNTLRSRAQDFQLTDQFSQYASTSSEEDVLGASVSGTTPTIGSYNIEVLQLASATSVSSSSRISAAVDPGATLSSAGFTTDVTAGAFSINGVEFTIDPETQSLNDVISQINGSSAGVTAAYDASTDTVSLTNNTPGDSSIINLRTPDEGSNFLSALNLTGATQLDNVDGTTTVSSTRNLGALATGGNLEDLAFEGGAVTGGSFRINGVEITVDPTTDSLSDILARINDSDAGVAASYDASNDTIRVASETLGSRTISFQSGTSNLLDRLNLVGATQTAGNDAQFRVNDGEILTRNTNEVADAVGGVTLNLLSAGTSTVTVERDVDAIVEDVQNFLGEINGAINNIVNRTRSGAVLAGDSSLRVIQNYVRNNMFLDVGGARGEFDNLLEIGISSGDNFSSEATMQYELDEEAFREALRSDSTSVASLFSNEDGDGIADRLEEYIDSVAGLDGFLNERARANGLIDQRIDGYNDQLDQMEERMQMRERRLRAQFTRMEQLASSYQQQSASLGGINTSLASLI